MRSGLAAACMLVVACQFQSMVAVAAAEPAPRAGTLTPEMVVATRGVGEVDLSPDGRRVAYVVSVPRAASEEKGSPHQEIWIVPATGGEARRYTPSGQRAWAPEFSPDGNRLAFLSTRAASTEGTDPRVDLYVLDLAGGEAQRASDGEMSVRAFHWSPDGRRIAFTAKDRKSEDEKQDAKHGRDQVVVGDKWRPARLWSVDVASGVQERLTSDDSHVLGFDWSPDGSRLALRTTATTLVDDDYLYSVLTLVPASGGVPAICAETRGKLGAPQFSPSGRYLAWLGARDLNDPFAGSVFVAPTGGGAAIEVTQGHPGVAMAFRWQNDETLAVAATRSTETVLALVSRQGGKPRVVVSGEPVFTDFDLSRSGKMIAFAASTPECPNEVFAGSVGGGGRPRRLTTTNPGLETVQLGTQEVVRWRAADGLEIEGILLRPLGAGAGRRVPLVVQVHGGPESCYRNGWLTSWSSLGQLLARDGTAVLFPNYRGSIGRDESFERGDHGDLMGSEFDDMLAGVDALVARGLVDRERVGIAGGSYGGYTTAWAVTAHSPRFAAGVAWAGITNWLSMQGTSDIPEENAVVHWNRPFYANMDLYWRRSPLAHVNECRTPLLLLHGEKDERVPIGQSEELYTALRLLDREVAFVRYPREEHGLKEAAHQLDVVNRSLDWFGKYLGAGRPGSVTAR